MAINEALINKALMDLMGGGASAPAPTNPQDETDRILFEKLRQIEEERQTREASLRGEVDSQFSPLIKQMQEAAMRNYQQPADANPSLAKDMGANIANALFAARFRQPYESAGEQRQKRLALAETQKMNAMDKFRALLGERSRAEDRVMDISARDASSRSRLAENQAKSSTLERRHQDRLNRQDSRLGISLDRLRMAQEDFNDRQLEENYKESRIIDESLKNEFGPNINHSDPRVIERKAQLQAAYKRSQAAPTSSTTSYRDYMGMEHKTVTKTSPPEFRLSGAATKPQPVNNSNLGKPDIPIAAPVVTTPTAAVKSTPVVVKDSNILNTEASPKTSFWRTPDGKGLATIPNIKFNVMGAKKNWLVADKKALEDSQQGYQSLSNALIVMGRLARAGKINLVGKDAPGMAWERARQHINIPYIMEQGQPGTGMEESRVFRDVLSGMGFPVDTIDPEVEIFVKDVSRNMSTWINQITGAAVGKGETPRIAQATARLGEDPATFARTAFGFFFDGIAHQMRLGAFSTENDQAVTPEISRNAASYGRLKNELGALFGQALSSGMLTDKELSEILDNTKLGQAMVAYGQAAERGPEEADKVLEGLKQVYRSKFRKRTSSSILQESLQAPRGKSKNGTSKFY